MKYAALIKESTMSIKSHSCFLSYIVAAEGTKLL